MFLRQYLEHLKYFLFLLIIFLQNEYCSIHFEVFPFWHSLSYTDLSTDAEVVEVSFHYN